MLLEKSTRVSHNIYRSRPNAAHDLPRSYADQVNSVYAALSLSTLRISKIIELQSAVEAAIISADYSAELSDKIAQAAATIMTIRQLQAVMENGIDPTTLSMEEVSTSARAVSVLYYSQSCRCE